VEGETLVGSVKVKKAFSKHTTMEVQVSTAGKVELATDRKVSKHSTVGVAVSVGRSSRVLFCSPQRYPCTMCSVPSASKHSSSSSSSTSSLNPASGDASKGTLLIYLPLNEC
jgi:hypothetical protein